MNYELRNPFTWIGNSFTGIIYLFLDLHELCKLRELRELITRGNELHYSLQRFTFVFFFVCFLKIPMSVLYMAIVTFNQLCFSPIFKEKIYL